MLKLKLIISLYFSIFVLHGQNTLLWEISRNDLPHKSYLYGTFHSKDSRAHEFGDSVLIKLNQVEMIVVESIDLEEEKNSLKALELLMMEGGEKLESLLNENDYEFVQEQILNKMGMAGLFYNNMKPIFTIIMAVELNSLQEMPYTVDDFFKQESKRLNKKLIGLESTEEAMNALNSIPLKEQAKMLVDFFKNFDTQMILRDSIITLYQNQRINELYSFYQNQKNLHISIDKELVVKRNNKFVERLIPLINEDAVFCAVGALHLTGDLGLINLLQKQGYILTPIYSNYKDKKMIIEDERNWYYYENDTMNLMMQFTDDPYLNITKFPIFDNDSIEMINYFFVDSINQIKYMASVGKTTKQITLEEITNQLKKNEDWKKVKENDIIYMGLPSKELEFNIAPKINIYYNITLKEDKVYLLSVAGYKPKIYSNLSKKFFENISFSIENVDKNLKLIGYVKLIDNITEKGDTIYSKNNEAKINVSVYDVDTDEKLDSIILIRGDTVYHDLPFNRIYKIVFHCEHYQDKGFYIDTRNIPLQSETYSYGAEFPYNLNLVKSTKTNNTEIKYVISYDKEKDYFGIGIR